MMKRHPAEVTADRLLKHYEDWWHRMNGTEREALSLVRFVLIQIAEGDR